MYIDKYPENRDPDEDWSTLWRYGKRVVVNLTIFAVMMMIIGMLTGCKTVEEVPVIVERVLKDTVRISKVEHDTVIQKDSIYVESYMKNDTAHLNMTKIAYRYLVRDVHDTTYIAKHDTVPMPYTVVEKVEVEKKLNFFTRMLMWTGGFALLIVAILAGSYVWRIWGDWRRLTR